jgi:putative polymerase
MYQQGQDNTFNRSGFLNTETLSGGILIAAVFFNAALAVVNAHFRPLSKTDVTLIEAAITGCAILIIAYNMRADMVPWAMLFVSVLTLHLLMAIANQTFNPKFIRDGIDIPIFIALGIVFSRGNIIRLLFGIQCVVLLGVLFELLFVGAYSNVFNVQSYYEHTRGFTSQNFYNTDSTLFASATRPTGRFLLSFLGDHRASSTFLEPVSLGNYSILATLFTLTFWRVMSRPMKIFFIASTAIILVGSDSRLAAATCIVLLFGCVIFPLLPRYSNLLYLPGIVSLCAIIVISLGLQNLGDNFAGRIAFSVNFLSSLDILTILGLDSDPSRFGFDSGIGYFLISQSVFGLAAVWLFVCLVPRYDDRRSIVFVHGLCLSMSLILMVSYSVFSIKTAALMWFVYGYLLPEIQWRRPSLHKPLRMHVEHQSQRALG